MTLFAHALLTARRSSIAACAMRAARPLASLLLGAALVGAAQGAQILESYSASLTTYLYAGNTDVQGVRPRHDQRGVHLDGSARSGAFFGWAFAGNPFESGAGGARLGDIRLDIGAYSPSFVDIALPASPGGAWVVGRTYNGLQETSSPAHLDSDGYQGKNWFQSSQPEIRLFEGASDDLDVVYIVYGADRYLEFQRVGESDVEFKGKNGAAGVVKFVAGTPDTYVYFDQHGTLTYFFGGDTDSGRADWQLWKVVGAADSSGSHTAYVGHRTTAATAVSDGYNADGTISKAYDSAGRRYCYTYSTIDSVSRLTQVLAETDGGNGWGSCGEDVTVGKVEYAYYQTGDNTYGGNGNLKQATITTPLTDSSINLVRKQLFRYWVGAYDVSTNPGYANTIKLVVDAEGVRRYDWGVDSSLDDDHFTASTDDLKPYSSYYLEYDSSYRVRAAFLNGDCGCGGGNNGTHDLTYGTNGSFSPVSGYDTEWHRRTVVDQPDGVFATQYFDELGQPLSRVVTNTDPSGSPTKTWVTEVVRNSDGQVEEVRTPAANDTYTHSTGAIAAETGAGLITALVRKSSTDLKGYVEETRWKVGTSGTAYLSGSTVWTSRALVVGSSGVTRPLVDSTTAYTHEITSGSSGAYTTDVTYDDFYSSTNTNVQYLAPKKTTTAHPTVSTGTNGSNSPNAKETHQRSDGTVAWVKHEDGNHDYSLVENGLPTRSIRDYDSDEGSGVNGWESGDAPTGGGSYGLTISSSGFHAITKNTFDAQGRRDTTTLPSVRVTKSYYSKLADGRMVTISWPRYTGGGTPTYYGPASYTVTNHAGQAEFQGTIASTSSGLTTALTGWIDEADADPITALDAGTLARMSTTVMNSSGTRATETRAYHTIPGSGAGSVGTNYDKSSSEYDDMGRKVKSVDPTGTIALTDYDELGRVTKHWMGTDDSGTGSDNMVNTERLEYDGGSAGGNSLLTKRTTDADGDWTTTGDKRETTLAHDARGRVLLTTNPVAPHVLTKYDNMGRAVATAKYSSTGSITPGTTDPAGSGAGDKANRVALSTTYFDEMGRVYKTQRHKITQSDGTDADYLATLTWYDSEGRVIKVKGETITKTAYDRIGRTTHRFTIAYDNDSGYSDADDVSGDYVLEESQTVYQGATSNNVIWRAVIARRHDDRYSGSTYATTGALDANADGGTPALTTLTGADVKGRVQITAMWHDSWDRLTDTVMYGTNGIVGDGSTGTGTFTRPGSPPSRSDTELRTTTVFDDDGTVLETEDPKGLKTRYAYDKLGRQTAVIANYVNGTPSGANADDDVFTRSVYTSGLKTKYWVDLDGDNVEDGTDQVTVYTYGTTKGVSAGDSQIATGHLLQKITYPDSGSGSDVVTFAYNALSAPIWTKDQAGNVIETDIDAGGRETHRRVTTIITPDFDNRVLRISTAYLSRGLRDTITQYDDKDVGEGTALDQVKYSYDDWGNLTGFEQDKDSTVGGASGADEYEVAYTLSKATPTNGAVAWRRTAQLLKSGSTTLQTLNFEYDDNTSGSGYKLDELASRVTRVKISSTPVAEYHYVGTGMLVGVDYPEPDVRWLMYTGAPATYPDMDSFNRVTSSRWTSYITSPKDFYDVDVVYDRDSNVARVQDNIWKKSNGDRNFDAVFSMDSLNRLTEADEGEISSTTINNSKRSRKQEWTLNQPGDWVLYKMDLNGGNPPNYSDGGELNDTQTFNTVNEIETRDTDTNASVNYTQVHDDVGNLIDDGKDYEYLYDAFGRLIEVRRTDNQNLVAEYRYNGLNHRIGWHYDVDADGTVESPGGSGDSWFYFAYDERWRMVGTFRENDTNPKEVFTTHHAGRGGYGSSSLLDGVICRDKDNDGGGWNVESESPSTEERIYYCQNWRGDVVAVVSSGGAQRLEARYSAYGVPFGFPAGDLDADGDCDFGDLSIIGGWIGVSYDVRGDMDLDGDVDAADQTTLAGLNFGVTLGRGQLSRTVASAAGGIRKGYAGYEHDGTLMNSSFMHVRNRMYMAELGRWTRRDPIGYVDGMSLYAYVQSDPLGTLDPEGLRGKDLQVCCATGVPGECVGRGPVPSSSLVTLASTAAKLRPDASDMSRTSGTCSLTQAMRDECTDPLPTSSPNIPPKHIPMARPVGSPDCDRWCYRPPIGKESPNTTGAPPAFGECADGFKGCLIYVNDEPIPVCFQCTNGSISTCREQYTLPNFGQPSQLCFQTVLCVPPRNHTQSGGL